MIIVFGSINYDFIFHLETMPQPGQTLLTHHMRNQAGGKGANQAVAAARAGVKTVMVGAVGRDALTEQALKNLTDCGVDLTNVARFGDAPTGCASITIDTQGQNTIIVAPGANMLAKAEQIDEALLAQADFVLIQMENDPDEIAKLIRRAHALQRKVILNLAPAIFLPHEVLSLCYLVIVNEDEMEALAGWLDCSIQIEAVATKLNTNILHTLGKNGSEAFVENKKIHVDAISVKSVDTTAAGDCFIGVFAACLEQEISVEQAMQRASCAAALAVTRRGSQSSIPTAQETDLFIAQL